MPFLSIVTRHMATRPGMFANCVRSLQAQAEQDFEHIVLVDYVGRGIEWANAQFALHRLGVAGDYVQMLDDDMVAAPGMVARLKQAAEGEADIIMFRSDHKQLGILPTPAAWGSKPLFGHVDGHNLIVRCDVWQRHINQFCKPKAGDFAFIKTLFDYGYRVCWLDELLVRAQRISNGAAE